MKKMRRLLAVLMVISMMLGVMPVVVSADDTATTANTVNVTVGVGQSVTRQIENSSNTTVTVDDQTVASVSANKVTNTVYTGETVTSPVTGNSYYIQVTDGSYLKLSGGNLTYVTSINDATAWTYNYNNNLRAYTFSSGNYYLTYNSGWGVTTKTNNNYRGFSIVSGEISRSNSGTVGYMQSPTKSNEVDVVNVEITGNAVGTTTATVGTTTYNIKVVPADLANAESLTVEFWITNRQVTANGSTSMTVAAADAYGEDGVLFSSLVPETGTYDSNVMAFWKGTLHTDTFQTTSKDLTADGIDFTYVRYYNGVWSYLTEDGEWSEIGSAQVVAYYLQSTEVTKEITTQVVDWGIVPYNSYNSTAYVLLDYAVKYEDGTLTPAGFPNSETTMAFHCDSNDTNTVEWDSDANAYFRTIKMIRAVETTEYEVYMITVTPTSDNASDKFDVNCKELQSYTYSGTEKVVWVAHEDYLGIYADSSLQYAGFTVGGDAIVPSLNIYNQQGMLVTYYVRARATETSLGVHYIDNTTGEEFYSYNIAVKDDETGVFDPDFALDSTNEDTWLTGNTVTNFYGKKQTVSAKLDDMPEIGAQYKYSNYVCTKAERTEDGKDVYLYYDFNPVVKIVADFGLPIKISPSDLSDKLNGVEIDSVTVSEAGISDKKYGTLTVENSQAVYTLTKTLNEFDTFTVLVTTKNEVEGILDEASSTIAFRVYVYPATTVYYEENFATYNGDWASTGTANAKEQTVSIVGSGANYGYESNYNTIGVSNGTEVQTSDTDATATFSFVGTGVEIYTNNTTDTGIIMVQLTGTTDDNESVSKTYFVDTAMVDGATNATVSQAVTAYSTPIISIRDLAHGTYQLNMVVAEGTVSLDGFRVHGTLTDANSVYAQDNEASPTFVELRDATLYVSVDALVAESETAQAIAKGIMTQVYNASGKDTVKALVLGQTGTYSDDATTADKVILDVIENGPKNEIYLESGETLVFAANAANMQVGLKALNTTTTASIVSSLDTTGKTYTINSCVDMFYAVPASDAINNQDAVFTITNTGEGTLSVTLLKMFNAAAVKSQLPASVETGGITVAAVNADTLASALILLGYEDETPDATLVIDVDCGGKTYRTTLKADSATGDAGKAHTFTVADIHAALDTLNLPDGYRLGKQALKAVRVAYGASETLKLTAQDCAPGVNADDVLRSLRQRIH
ncbi:MAG: hypothetical protein IJ449_12220 [Clostridia bacterium]|nr:hypothetical protein [Clostridia bacterium]